MSTVVEAREAQNKKGRFGKFGGQYLPETLMPALLELEEARGAIVPQADFQKELECLLREYAGRPTPLYHARRLSEHLGGPRIYLKREDLNHTGSHKLNNTLGQALLARRMGKKRLIAETGAGQHGVATATVAALFGLECVVYMGEEDVRRQALNVFRMRLLGTEVRPVQAGSRTLKDAMNEALRDWVTNVGNTFYVIGSVAGPHPYPSMVRDFQAVIGREAREQILAAEGELPAACVACVGGGSNAMGLFHPFRDDPVHLVGVEAAGRGLATGEHSASLTAGSPGILHGSLTYLLQDGDGQILPAHSVAAGLDYPGVGPEHSFFKESGRAEYVSVTDEQALSAFKLLSRLEGIIPALESSHAVAFLPELTRRYGPRDRLVLCLSGRGDKDAQGNEGLLAEGSGA